MNRSLFSITRYMNGVCFKVSGGTSVTKLPPSYPPPPPPEVCMLIFVCPPYRKRRKCSCENAVVVLIVLCFGVEFLCCLGLMCVFIFLVQFG